MCGCGVPGPDTPVGCAIFLSRESVALVDGVARRAPGVGRGVCVTARFLCRKNLCGCGVPRPDTPVGCAIFLSKGMGA